MASTVSISDFVGETQLQVDNFTEVKLNVIRDQWENTYLYKLMGAELGKLFIADLNGSGVPVAPRFLDLYNAFVEDINHKVVESRGIKDYITGIVWYFYTRNNPIIVATGGNKVKKSQNSTELVDNSALARIFNRSIDDGKAIQRFIWDNSATYPEFKGQELKYVIGF